MNISTAYERVSDMLTDGRLIEACAFLSVEFKEHSTTRHLIPKVEELRQDFLRLMNFFGQGTADPHRHELRDQLADRAWSLAEAIYNADCPRKPVDPIDITSRLTDLSLDPQDDRKLGVAFESISHLRYLGSDDRKAIHMAILNEQLPEYVRAALLSALTLMLTQWFDDQFVEYLYIYTLDDQPTTIRVRAWAALVFVALIHPQRIAHLPRLREQYHLICESEPELLFDIQVGLLLCREALSSEKKIHHIAGLEESSQNNIQQFKEFLALISEGIDMSFHLFMSMTRLPFFQETFTRHHWLMPFCPEQPNVKAVLDAHPDGYPWAKMLMQSVAQCDTDKYGTFISMSASNNQLMETLSKKLVETGLVSDQLMSPPLPFAMRSYLHDLFRYFYYHPDADYLRYRPFKMDLLMSRNPWLCKAVDDTEKLRKVAELLLRKERWREASYAYEQLLKHEVTEESLQRLAYVRQRAKDGQSTYMDQLEPLMRANRLFPGNRWTLRQMADIYHIWRQPLLEEQVIQEALQHFPDDIGLLARLGRCLIDQHRPEEALHPLYKADVQKEGQVRVLRELSRAQLHLHDHGRAERYIRQVLNRTDPQEQDWALGGHIALFGHDIALAIERYERAPYIAITDLNSKRELFIDLGVDPMNITLLLDYLHTQLHRD